MIVLTPNRRLAAFSLLQYNNAQVQQGKNSFVSAAIYPLEVWLLRIWYLCLDHNLSFYKPLLTPKQQQLLFEQIIQEDSATELLRVNATAQNAIQAWSFICQWQIDLQKIEAFIVYNADTAAFYKWLQKYRDWLTQHNFIDFNLVVATLIKNLEPTIHLWPKQVVLRGFNELTPQYAELFKLLAQYGIAITHDSLADITGRATRIGLENSSQELFIAANYIKQELAENPEQLFGVVVPDLEQRRIEVYNTFTQALPLEWLNISAPKPLLHYEMIHIALLILKLAAPLISFDDLSILLRTPFIGEYTKYASERAILDRELREQVEAQFNINYLLKILPKDSSIHKYITDFATIAKDIHGKHSAKYWVNIIQQLLVCIGWPGERILTSVEGFGDIAKDDADLLTCWQNLLDEYATLNAILPKHNFAQAISYMHRFASETPFAKAETGLTKVHVLGLLEAEGLVFDKLWVCGMSREQWPSAANPNPFIPLEIQRAYDLPHNCAERELTMAKKYTANLKRGGKHVIFSYPQFIDDNKVAPSNLIIDLPEQSLTINAEVVQKEIHLEHWLDQALGRQDGAYIGGGAKSLRLQAQCPFKAQAEMHLSAKELEEPQSILTKAMRGSIVHEVLEKFWRKCTSHAQLLLLSQEQLEKLVNATIQEVLDAWHTRLPNTLTNTYMLLEAHSLHNLMQNWLEFEKKRTPFVIYQLEQKTLINIGPLQINMRIDRVDQVNDGYVIIDYKTGYVQMQDWFSEPIYEPQLPIYAISLPKNIHAVAFAVMQINNLAFKGIAVEEELLPEVSSSENWHALLTQWRTTLERTAQDFVDGIATVTPYDPKICRVCKLQALCRIYEQ